MRGRRARDFFRATNRDAKRARVDDGVAPRGPRARERRAREPSNRALDGDVASSNRGAPRAAFARVRVPRVESLGEATTREARRRARRDGAYPSTPRRRRLPPAKRRANSAVKHRVDDPSVATSRSVERASVANDKKPSLERGHQSSIRKPSDGARAKISSPSVRLRERRPRVQRARESTPKRARDASRRGDARGVASLAEVRPRRERRARESKVRASRESRRAIERRVFRDGESRAFLRSRGVALDEGHRDAPPLKRGEKSRASRRRRARLRVEDSSHARLTIRARVSPRPEHLRAKRRPLGVESTRRDGASSASRRRERRPREKRVARCAPFPSREGSRERHPRAAVLRHAFVPPAERPGVAHLDAVAQNVRRGDATRATLPDGERPPTERLAESPSGDGAVTNLRHLDVTVRRGRRETTLDDAQTTDVEDRAPPRRPRRSRRRAVPSIQNLRERRAPSFRRLDAIRPSVERAARRAVRETRERDGEPAPRRGALRRVFVPAVERRALDATRRRAEESFAPRDGDATTTRRLRRLDPRVERARPGDSARAMTREKNLAFVRLVRGSRLAPNAKRAVRRCVLNRGEELFRDADAHRPLARLRHRPAPRAKGGGEVAVAHAMRRSARERAPAGRVSRAFEPRVERRGGGARAHARRPVGQDPTFASAPADDVAPADERERVRAIGPREGESLGQV